MPAAARTLLTVMVLVTALLSPVRPANGQSLGVAPPVAPTAPPSPAIPSGPMLGPPTPYVEEAGPAPVTPPPIAPAAPGGPAAMPGPTMPASPLAPPPATIYEPRPPAVNGWGIFGPISLPSMWFANVEVDILHPILKAALTSPVTFANGTQVNVQPPTTSLSWTAAPRFEVGWLLPNNFGLFAISYRGFATQGNGTATSLDGTPFSLRTRLDLNQMAFDYGTMPYIFAPRWDLITRIGVAFADVYFDNQAISTTETQYASNNFIGGGPHVRGDLNRHVGFLPGLDLFGRADLMVLVGEVQQNYNEILTTPFGTSVGLYNLRRTQTVPVLTLQAGLTYTPPRANNWHFTTGYQYEEWWRVGQVEGLPPRGQFNTNGVFLRAAVEF
jgi:hypothetical protein